MHNSWKTVQIAGLVCGFCFAACLPVAAGASGVIRDSQWTIKVRSTKRTVNAAPAVAKQPEAERPPAPALVDPAPAKTDVKPVDPNAAVPATDPATTTPASNVDAAIPSTDLVPDATPRAITYEEAYAQVPFSRTEYEANPTYRHQAALEVMFRTLRPTTMVQNFTPRAFRYPDSYQIPYSRSETEHINVRNYGGGYHFNGQSPFGYPYGLKGNW